MTRSPGLMRRAGADLPFGDSGRDHGAALEGYYWRIVDARERTVIVALCGLCRGEAGRRWALVALAAQPEGTVRHAILEPATGDPHGFGVRAGELLDGSLSQLRLRLDADNWIDAALGPALAWPSRPFGAMGAAHLIPGLPQYWQPLLLDGAVRGEACLGGRRRRLEGARVYAEKNWGPQFAGRWWWGQAGAFAEGELGVAFAGGRLTVPGGSVAPTAAVVWLGPHVLSFSSPLSRSLVSAAPGRWRVRMRSPRYRLEIEGESGEGEPLTLPVPEPGRPRVVMRSRQLLDGRLQLRLRFGRRTIIDAGSSLAGLELGHPAGELQRVPPAPPPR